MDDNRMIVDVQITRILYSYYTDKSYDNKHLENFIECSKVIYINHKDYLLKMVRIFLQLCKPSDDDIFDLKQGRGQQQKKIENLSGKIEDYD